MKVAIFAGGFGTCISEESVLKPKPMVEIGDKPILWHIMKLYSHYGYNEFVICCGYKQHMIKEWFADYYLHSCDVTFDFTRENKMTVHNNISEPWKVTLVDTGLNTMTGGRIKRVREHLNGEPFFLTYGDGVADINIAELLKFHQGRRAHGNIDFRTANGTIRRAGSAGRWRNHKLQRENRIQRMDQCRIYGTGTGDPDLIEGDAISRRNILWEEAARRGQLDAYRHNGFWAVHGYNE